MRKMKVLNNKKILKKLQNKSAFIGLSVEGADEELQPNKNSKFNFLFWLLFRSTSLVERL